MGDVAQILKDTKIDGEEKSSTSPSKAMAMSGLPKDVMKLLGGKQDPKSASLPPIVPTTTSSRDIKVKVGNKTISSSKPARQWTWAPFCSSARTDGAIFSHWVRANVEYTDYPYAKFDIHLDPVAYNDEDYEALLHQARHLVDLRLFEFFHLVCQGQHRRAAVSGRTQGWQDGEEFVDNDPCTCFLHISILLYFEYEIKKKCVL